MPKFVKGLALCRQFFLQAAKPLLEQYFPNLPYTAGLLGYGSDVLGYDDEVSTDHMWGPRFYLFLREQDLPQRPRILEMFSRRLPYTFLGYSVNFSAPDLNDNGVRHPEPISCGLVSPLIFIYTTEQYLDSYLGVHDLAHLGHLDWLSFSEHRLLALTSAALFKDDLALGEKLSPLRYYPEEVRLYLIASNWSLVAEEQAFVRRCADVGDEAGSALACARIAERLMRLAFLYCRRYAPYSKWFGTAFQNLPVDPAIHSAVLAALTAPGAELRERNLLHAQQLLAQLHNTLRLTEPVSTQIASYYGRDIKVIFADQIAQQVQRKLAGTPLERLPLIGALSQVANFTVLSDAPEYRESIQRLYDVR